MNDFQLAQAFSDAALGREARELIARLLPTVLTRVDAEKRLVLNEMLTHDDTSSPEYRRLHLQARVLGEFFRQLDEVQLLGKQAEALIEQAHDDAADEMPQHDPRVDSDE